MFRSTLAGIAAGVTEAFVVVPFELVKIRLQAKENARPFFTDNKKKNQMCVQLCSYILCSQRRRFLVQVQVQLQAYAHANKTHRVPHATSNWILPIPGVDLFPHVYFMISFIFVVYRRCCRSASPSCAPAGRPVQEHSGRRD